MGVAEGEPRRLRGVVLRQSTYTLALAAMQETKPPHDTLATFIDNAVETYARAILNGQNQDERMPPHHLKVSSAHLPPKKQVIKND